MEVILLEKIQNVGGLGDRVTVKPGYARNYLVPQGKALTASPANVAVFESRRAELEALAAAEVSSAEQRAKSLEALELRIERKVNSGRLFGSVSAVDIVDALAAQGAEVKRGEVRLPEGPIRNTGSYEIRIHVHPDVDALVKLAVVSEDGEEEELEELAAQADADADADADPDADPDADLGSGSLDEAEGGEDGEDGDPETALR